MFELEVQSADVKALDVNNWPEQPLPEPVLDDDDSDDDDVNDDEMSTFIDDGDDEEDVTDPPLNTILSVSSNTIEEALEVDDPPEQPPPEPIPEAEGDNDGAPLPDNHPGPDIFIDDGTDDEDIEDGAEERKNEESMKQLGDGGDSRGGGSDYFVRPERVRGNHSSGHLWPEVSKDLVQSAEPSTQRSLHRSHSIPMAVSFKQNRHLSELEEYRSGANSNDVAKDGAAMHTDRRYLYQ